MKTKHSTRRASEEIAEYQLKPRTNINERIFIRVSFRKIKNINKTKINKNEKGVRKKKRDRKKNDN